MANDEQLDPLAIERALKDASIAIDQVAQNLAEVTAPDEPVLFPDEFPPPGQISTDITPELMEGEQEPASTEPKIEPLDILGKGRNWFPDFQGKPPDISQDEIGLWEGAIPPPEQPSKPPPIEPDPNVGETFLDHDEDGSSLMAMRSYREETRRWRRNMLELLQYMIADLQADNALLESMLRHYELSRRTLI